MPPCDRRRRRGGGLPLAAWMAAAAAVAVYLNTLPAQFTFDDSFAVLYTGDVTDRSKPLRTLFSNDFWGQDLRSPMSHKSYRPLTVLSFRAQHRLSAALLGEERAPAAEAAVGERRRGSSGVRPLLFHACNVAAHAGVTLLIYRLAQRLAAARRQEWGSAASTRGGQDAAGTRSSWLAPAALEPLLAALLFALHPVHTEAVAGIVGHAELLCAALSIPALLCYMDAAEGRAGAGRWSGHWARVAAAVVLGWAAAGTKEIGITIMGAMICYDLLVAPLAPKLPAHLPRQPDGQPSQQQQQQQQASAPAKVQQPSLSPSASFGRERGHSRGASPAAVAAAATELLQIAAAAGKGGGGGAGGGGSSSSAVSELSPVARMSAVKLKLQRMAVAAAAVVLYVKARSWLAGDQLVRIYRKVENPIPFAPATATRALTTGHLHARYAWLLLWPLRLSADWSYACVEYVSGLGDARNLGTLALYLALAWAALAARPWRVLAQWAGRRPAQPGAAEQAARWRLAVAAGLLVGPFFPASNVLFYVGTFIGERLLYFPSVGFCILLAQLCTAALQPLLPSQEPGTGGRGADGQSQRSPPSRVRRACAVVAAALLASLLCFYAGRTVLRNRDWRDEEALFRAAQKVCWRSGKVQLNSGIIERRYQNWAKAEEHFRLARAADPQGFCEPDFHLGVTLLNTNLTRALEYLEAGVACKYTAADAVKALNQVYQQLLESVPQQAGEVMERWAAVLARPQLQRYAEAATYLESAALRARSPLHAALVLNRAQALLSEARPVAAGRTPDFPVRSAATPASVELLARCLAARRPVVLAAVGASEARGGAGLASHNVKAAAYRYIALHGAECRQPAAAPDAADSEEAAQRSTTFHTTLLHALQQADVNDPWLQAEWGRMLVAGGRGQEALAHLEVAGHIFAAQLQPTEGAAPRGTVLGPTAERAIQPHEAAEAAAAAYVDALRVVHALPQAGAAAERAVQLRAACRLLLQVCAVRQQQASLAQGAAAAAAAGEALQECLADARQLGCSPAGAGSGGSSSGPAAAAVKDELR